MSDSNFNKFYLFKPESEGFIGPCMVPVADILNHVAKNNAEIRYFSNQLQICTKRAILKVNIICENLY